MPTSTHYQTFASGTVNNIRTGSTGSTGSNKLGQVYANSNLHIKNGSQTNRSGNQSSLRLRLNNISSTSKLTPTASGTSRPTEIAKAFASQLINGSSLKNFMSDKIGVGPAKATQDKAKLKPISRNASNNKLGGIMQNKAIFKTVTSKNVENNV